MNETHHARTFDVDTAVRRRYAAASQATEPALCCPVTYDARYLKILPRELLERDYGCGDPSRWVRPGETVLDLGSGGGKICFIAAQVVGSTGRVIGVDYTDEMLALARRFQPQIAAALGYDNVSFRKGRIQDLALDLERFAAHLSDQPVRNVDDWWRAAAYAERLRQTEPMIADESIDIVVSNCVLNLVRPDDRRKLFAEIFRVLAVGGRAVISDITSDRPVPSELQRDPQLWSGCLSGAFEEREFGRAFAAAGFSDVEIVARQAEPWAVVDGIEFRSLTASAFRADLRAEPRATQPVERASSPGDPPRGCSSPGCC